MANRGTTHTRLQKQLSSIIKQALADASMNTGHLCRECGLSPPYVSQLLSGERIGTLDTWDKLLMTALGLKAQIGLTAADFSGLGR